MFRVCTLLTLAICSIGQAAFAQQVPTDPTSSHIFPAGGQRGTTVLVRVGGECLPPYTKFRLQGEGLKSSEELGAKVPFGGEPSPRRKPEESHIFYPKEWEHAIEIAADAPLGMKLWRLSSARGGTGGRPFLVGDLKEHIETESNSLPSRAEPIAFPITINGQISGERDLDYYQLQLTAGQTITIDAMAQRLGSPLELVVKVVDEQGNRVECVQYRAGSDPVLVFSAPKDGVYRLLFSNLGVQGGPQYVYRATITDRPYVAFAYPPGGTLAHDNPLRLFQVMPIGSLAEIPFQFTPRETGAGDQWQYETLPSCNAMPLEATSLPSVVESEDASSPANNTAMTAQRISTPASIYGRFLSADDEDWYRFNALKDSQWSVECRRFPMGTACLPVVSICDANGAPLAMVNSVDDLRRSSRLEWKAPADGEYCLRLYDVQRGIRGGQDFIYRTTLLSASPGFELFASVDHLDVIQGGNGTLEIKARRWGGFSGAIDLSVEPLPEGVKLEQAQIPVGGDTVKLTFVADAKARPVDLPIKVLGKAMHENQMLQASLQAEHLGHDPDGVSLGNIYADDVHLTLRHKSMLRLYCSEAYQYAYRGTIYPYLMEVERLEGFNGPIHLEVADRQIKDLDGIEVIECSLTPDQSKIMLPIYLPETMHINVQAHSNVYAQAWIVFTDAWGQKQSQAIVSEMRCMIRPLPTVAKLSAVDKQIIAQPGETVSCTLKLQRTSLFEGEMEVTLASGSVEGALCDPVMIPQGDSSAVVKVQLPAGISLKNDAQLKFRATGKMPGYVSVITETAVPVVAN